MKLEILVTTMHAADFSLVEKMNLRDVDVVIANQTDHCSYEQQNFPDRNVRAVMVSTNTRGLGLNRNIALSYASGDILLFADDDMTFVEGFQKLVTDAFAENPKADAVKFYCESTSKVRKLSFRQPKNSHRAGYFELTPAGAVCLAIRREKQKKLDLFFPTSIGAGTEFYKGEDTVFYQNMVRAGLQIYVNPALLAYVAQDGSSWFNGYDAHFFEVTGYIYAKLYGKAAVLFALRRAFRYRGVTSNPFHKRQMFYLMRKGIRQFRS